MKKKIKEIASRIANESGGVFFLLRHFAVLHPANFHRITAIFQIYWHTDNARFDINNVYCVAPSANMDSCGMTCLSVAYYLTNTFRRGCGMQQFASRSLPFDGSFLDIPHLIPVSKMKWLSERATAVVKRSGEDSVSLSFTVFIGVHRRPSPFICPLPHVRGNKREKKNPNKVAASIFTVKKCSAPSSLSKQTIHIKCVSNK